MKKSSKIRLISFGAALVLVLGGLLLDARLMLQSDARQLEYAYLRALNDMTDYVSSMHSTLEKSIYVNTPVMRTTVSAKLLEESGSAKAAMATLPLSQGKAERISRFLSQVGDYAMSLAKKAQNNDALTRQEISDLQAMEHYASLLSEGLAEAQAHLSVKDSGIAQTKSVLNNVDEIEEIPLLDDQLDETAKEFSQFPQLLYDGPFSDHLLRRESLFLKDRAMVTKVEAAEIAAKFLGCRPTELQDSGETEGTLPAYVFLRENSRITVTKAGGEISYFKKSTEVSEAKLSYEDVLKTAKEFLQTLGLTSVRETYYVQNDNQCTINFAFVAPGEPEVLCYPDLLKITLELGEGGMLEYDAAGYLMNHHPREFSSSVLSEEEGRRMLSSLLSPTGSQLAVIPTAGLDEVLCREYRCTGEGGREFLVYLNAETGMEEQLYLLQRDEHGILVK